MPHLFTLQKINQKLPEINARTGFSLHNSFYQQINYYLKLAETFELGEVKQKSKINF